MINTVMFDFGDVFINLDKSGALENALQLFNLQSFEDDMLQTNITYETGHLSTTEFVSFYKSKFPKLTEQQIIDAWNHIIKDFPKYRLDWLKKLKAQNKYKLILLSNTNSLHIDLVKQQVPFYEEFKACFDAFYLSHQIHFRKPDKAIFEFVINKNELKPSECLFIDDTKENTATAKRMGFHVWTIDETKEDITQLFETKKELF